MTAAPILVVTGPTASGKSALGIRLAQMLAGEIVNVDSVQVYKDFTIGAAKPSAEELAQVPHHLLSYVEPETDYDAARFIQDAETVIAALQARQRLPIVVGGTGLYVRALVGGLVETPDISNQARLQVSDWESEGTECLYRQLLQLDPRTATGLNPRDAQRIKRALLVVLSSGESLSTLQSVHQQTVHQQSVHRYPGLLLILEPDRHELYRSIDARVDRMLEEGLVDEVVALQKRYSSDARPFGAIGYRHVCEHLAGRSTYEQMVEQLKRDTRRFAKRQMTWWRHQPTRLGWQELGVETIGASLISDTISDKIAVYLRQCQVSANIGVVRVRHASSV